jgi:hypothetical protein
VHIWASHSVLVLCHIDNICSCMHYVQTTSADGYGSIPQDWQLSSGMHKRGLGWGARAVMGPIQPLLRVFRRIVAPPNPASILTSNVTFHAVQPTHHDRFCVSQGLSAYRSRMSTFSRHTGHTSFLPTMVQPLMHSSWKQCLHANCRTGSPSDCRCMQGWWGNKTTHIAR